jgi:gliding motility-associated-like protein
MNFKLARLLLGFLAISPIIAVAQRGKDLNYTVTTSNDIVNTYTALTSNATAGATSISVTSNALSGAHFTGNLAAGDLILIVQMQGASMDIDLTNTTFTRPAAYVWDNTWTQSNAKVAEWGKILAYNNCGKYEQVEVLSVSGATTINLSCALQNTYTSSGHVQVIRVPRYNNLTLNAASTIIPATWNGTTGGVVAVEVNGTLTMTATSKITASGKGFRGGMTSSTLSSPAVQAGGLGSCTPHTNGPGNGGTQIGSAIDDEGGRKGEGIGGYEAEYIAQYSNYATGAPANGGGGGGYQNAGGGGGANIGASTTYTGKGVPSSSYAAGYWNIELAGFATSSSPGGGRGGYSLSGANQDALTVGPNNAAWCPNASTTDARRENGGLGGHPLTYDATRMFMGGGGGAGDQDNAQGGSGGSGGGIVFVQAYGTITGTGTFEANGAVGLNSNPTGQATALFPSSSNKKGNDGAGGGGAGGMVIVKNSTALPATITINANGGAGGNHNLTLYNAAISSEASGPGGGGAGGGIAYTSGSPIQTVTGGANGTSTSSQVSEFTANGATNGAAGISGNIITTYNITASNQTICSGSPVTLTATTTGTLPGTLSWYTTQFGGSPVATGTTYTPSPAPTTTTTYYVGVCPGSFRVPVVVTVNPKPTIAGTAVLTNPTCYTAGSITGLTVSGGTPSYTYSWNGTATPGMNYTNIPAGTYNLTVTDALGCTATSGPHTLVGTSGPIINSTAVVITNQSCNGTLGSITGITATGTGLSYSWSNSGGSALNASGLSANSYTLTVTDGNGCTATSGPHVVGLTAGPSVNAAGVTLTNPTCGNNNGSITGITATGTSLTYAWSPSGGAALNASSLGAGSYSLTVTDGNGCTATSGPHALVAVAGPTVNASAVSVVNENCGLGNGSVSGLVVNGGTPTITYAWSNTAQTTLSLSNLSAGSYSLTVTDGNGCTATSGPYTILNSGGPTINTTNVAIQNELCNGTLGSITGITATGTSLTYAWTNGGGSSLNATNLVAGSYSLTVTDGNGCTANVGPYSVGFTAGPSVNATAVVLQNATCGNNNGSITGITATGTSLTYAWSPSGGNALNASSLAAGSYTLTVTDGNGCTATSGPHVISVIAGPTVNSTNVVLTPENCGQANGAISGLVVNGGTPTLTYAWTNTAQTTLNLSNLSAGSYALTVTDGNGCVANAGPFSVSNAGGPSLNELNAVVTDISCTGTLGSITGITSTGTSLTYAWSNGGGSSINASNLNAGTYTLTVTDGNGCSTVSAPYTIDAPIPLAIDASNMMTMPTGCAANTGSITGIVVTGGVNPTYSWTNSSATTLDLSNLAAGSYTLTVNDDQGCTDNLAVSITVMNAPTISTATMVVSDEHCNQADGSITGIMVNGGTPGYTYSWNTTPPTLTANLSNVASGTYTLTTTDAAGCTDTETVTINEVGGPVIDLTTAVIVQPTCAVNGSISGITVTGVNPYSYTWTGTAQTTLDITNLAAGSYALTVTDNNGCQTTGTAIVLTAPAGPSIEFVWSPTAPNIDETVVFTNTSTGTGLTNPVWTIDGQNLTTTDITHVFTVAGSYVVTLTEQDANGCIGTSTQTIIVYDELVIPNVITANNDNVNDKFEISGLKPNTQVIILNRWGDVVFTSDNYLNDWGGKDSSGQLLTDGVYTFIVSTVEGKKYHGFVHLIR